MWKANISIQTEMKWIGKIHDVTKTWFFFISLGSFDLPVATVGRQSRKGIHVLHRVHAVVYSWDGVQISYSNGVAPLLVCEKSDLTFLFGCKDRWGCRLCLSRFDDFQPEHLYYFILRGLTGIGSSLMELLVPWLRISKWYFNSMLSCLNPSHGAVIRGVEVGQYFNKICTILSLIFRYFHLVLPINVLHMSGVFLRSCHCIWALYFCAFVMHSVESYFVSSSFPWSTFYISQRAFSFTTWFVFCCIFCWQYFL